MLRCGRFGDCRRSTLTYCLSIRFSAANCALDLKHEARMPRISWNKSFIGRQQPTEGRSADFSVPVCAIRVQTLPAFGHDARSCVDHWPGYLLPRPETTKCLKYLALPRGLKKLSKINSLSGSGTAILPTGSLSFLHDCPTWRASTRVGGVHMDHDICVGQVSPDIAGGFPRGQRRLRLRAACKQPSYSLIPQQLVKIGNRADEPLFEGYPRRPRHRIVCL
jgi:hypothetical protein